MIPLAVFIPVVLIVGIWWLSRNKMMPRKLKGLIFAVLGFGLAYAARNDTGDGPYVCAVGVIVGAAGVYFFFEGLKNEIISALREPEEMIEKDQT
jgi:hypothetical protein